MCHTVVCHQGLRLHWFNKLGDFLYDRAKTVFEHVLAEYQKSTPVPATTRAPSPSPETDIDFLMTLAMVPGVPVVPEASNVNITSKFKFYCILCQGGVLHHEETDNLLLWWKVCALAYFFNAFYMIYLSRFMHTSF